MSSPKIVSHRLYVILDPNFGERLKEIKSDPVWIVTSPVNEPVVHFMRAIEPQPDHFDITKFTINSASTTEERFLDELGTIDLHHGPYSTKFPYTVLDVIGTSLTEKIRVALKEIGFRDFAENLEGFTAKRSLDEAQRQQR